MREWRRGRSREVELLAACAGRRADCDGMRKVIVLDEDVARAISDALHRVEACGHDLTEEEDEMWSALSAAIIAAVNIDP